MDNFKLKPARVKKAISGDEIVVLGPLGKNGLPQELVLTLWGISAPRMDRLEPFCRDSKDYLRTMLAGKDVMFCNFVGAGKKQEAHIYLNDKNVAIEVLRAGKANLDEEVEDRRMPAEYNDYLDANREAKAGTKGIYSGQPKQYGSKGSLPTNVEELYKVARDKTFSGYIDDMEYNFNFKMVIKEYENTMNILIKGITVPIISADHAKLIRTFLYKNCIQQTLSYKVVEFNKDKEGLVVIEDNAGDENSITAKLLRAGFARIESGAAMKLDHSYFLSLKLHEDFAKRSCLQIWKDFAGNTGASFTKSMFEAIVLEVHSADCMTVANSANPNLDPQRVYLSNIKAQSMGNVNIENSTQPWAFEGKEFLRNLVVGKTVKCELEFKREIPTKDEDGNLQKDKTIVHQCCSLFIDGKNVSCEVLINGFAKATPPRGTDPFTPYLKEMNEAEDTAKKSQIAVHSKKTAPQHKYWDLTTPENRKKMKNFNMSGLNGSVMGVCEHIFNGSRLKIRVDTEKYYINFQCNGIASLRNDENMPIKGKYGEEAIRFAKQTCQQRNVKMDIESVDKYGICHGILYIGGKNYNTSLLASGLGYLNYAGKPSKIINELEDIQEKAKTSKIGLWSKFTPETLDIKGSSILTKADTSFRAYLVEMVDPHEFYLQNVDGKELQEIEEKMS